jgi:hypothetical protein
MNQPGPVTAAARRRRYRALALVLAHLMGFIREVR